MDDPPSYPVDETRPSPLALEDAPRTLSDLRRSLRGEDQHTLEGLVCTIQRRLPHHPLADPISPLTFVLLTMLVEQAKELERLRLQLARRTGAPVHPPFP
jgi:hypothetical protein